jgi:hypothetical protein
MLTRNRFHYDESDIENMVNINIKAKASAEPKAVSSPAPVASKPRASNTPDLLQFSILQGILDIFVLIFLLMASSK